MISTDKLGILSWKLALETSTINFKKLDNFGREIASSLEKTRDVQLRMGNIDPNTFGEFLEPEEYVDHGHLFTTNRIFNSKVELVNWAKETAMKANTYLIINRAQKIYNVVAKIKENRMQGRNTVEEVLCLSAKRGYRNFKESNALIDIVIAHPASIAMIRT
ncbi:hypothetical protein M9H77_29870 [Catharanthus roseus]|uniref:Uncharacterized protein n=1 Tax=Catharanthus roseus TaxID=4058 RepID=A0ACB9ZXV8_CATRO|nr:hypothetical protein M9H77_29870 [Catharanthus roseus]